MEFERIKRELAEAKKAVDDFSNSHMGLYSRPRAKYERQADRQARIVAWFAARGNAPARQVEICEALGLNEIALRNCLRAYSDKYDTVRDKTRTYWMLGTGKRANESASRAFPDRRCDRGGTTHRLDNSFAFDEQDAVYAGLTVAAELACGNLAAAHAALDRYWAVRGKVTRLTPAGVLAQSLAACGLNMRTANMLGEAGILTVEDLLYSTADRIREIPNLGEAAVRECRQVGAVWAELYNRLSSGELLEIDEHGNVTAAAARQLEAGASPAGDAPAHKRSVA